MDSDDIRQATVPVSMPVELVKRLDGARQAGIPLEERSHQRISVALLGREGGDEGIRMRGISLKQAKRFWLT
jgi:hypothetical protein